MMCITVTIALLSLCTNTEVSHWMTVFANIERERGELKMYDLI